jgi:hypothetical protein
MICDIYYIHLYNRTDGVLCPIFCTSRNLLFRPWFARIIPLFSSLARAKLQFRSKNRAIPCCPGLNRVIECLPRRFCRHSFLLLSLQRLDLLASRSSLVCRKGQQRDASHHRSEPRSRQVPFRQHQPVVPRVLHQPPSRLHQPLLYAGQRPV